MLPTIVIDPHHQFFGAHSSGDVACRLGSVLIESRYVSKNPRNSARRLCTVIATCVEPVVARNISLPQNGLLLSCNLRGRKQERAGHNQGHPTAFHIEPCDQAIALRKGRLLIPVVPIVAKHGCLQNARGDCEYQCDRPQCQGIVERKP